MTGRVAAPDAGAVPVDHGGIRIWHLSVPTTGGTAQVVLQYVREQVARGWQVTVMCPSTGWLGYAVRDIGADVAWWQADRGQRAATLDEVLQVSSALERWQPGLVHLHAAKAGLVGRLVVRGRIPTIYQPHAWSFLAGGRVTRRLALWWERFAARWADRVLCVSEGERTLAEARGIRCQTVVVPNGVDLADFPPAGAEERAVARHALGLPAGPLAVCVGRLSGQKGQHRLLDAWPGVVAAVQDAGLVLVGDGPDEESLRARASALPGVRLVGARTDIATWLAAADVVVVPSRYEGMPLVPLEAMASARSLVATRIPGIEEGVALGCGALVERDDVGQLAEEIVRRLQNPRLADTEGRRGHEHVSAHHDALRSARRVAQLSLALMATRRRR